MGTPGTLRTGTLGTRTLGKRTLRTAIVPKVSVLNVPGVPIVPCPHCPSLVKTLLLICILTLSACSTNTERPVNTARIATATDPTSLDPRYVHDTSTITILHMLYEGLMRINPDGQVIPALAESVSLSDDHLTYTFTLRVSKWSNGEILTAKDFVHSWTSVLNSKKASPNAYQLYPIKGAEEYHLGKGPFEEVALTAPNDQTLIVTLKEPTPYFLELVSSYFYYPVHASEFVGNGPFKLESWKHNDVLSLSKNPHYWDSEHVHLTGIEVTIVDENTALNMYQKEELDWIGSPMSEIPQDAIVSLQDAEILHFAPAGGTHWFRFNTELSPFTNQKMRRAFALAINRKEIVEHITQGGQKPATSLIPPIFKKDPQHLFHDHNVAEAKKLFQEALVEMQLEKESLPNITLCYKAGDRTHKIAQAIQQQWQQIFNVDIKLESCESKQYFERVSMGNFMISSGSWYADFADPINFLNIFKHKNNASNNTQWENEHYIALLDASEQETDPIKREEYLYSAEEILMHEMPVAPLFFGEFNFAKKNTLQNVYLSPLGYLDFKDAYFCEPDSEE